MFPHPQPLLDAMDGSPEQVQKALTLSQMCWNLANSPEDTREEFLASMQPALRMDDDEFEECRRTVATPMIRRHEEMFPALRCPEARNSTGGVCQASRRRGHQYGALSRSILLLGAMNAAPVVAERSTGSAADDEPIADVDRCSRSASDACWPLAFSAHVAIGLTT
jgi:hypothetical protein